jgi:hypothetical protein
MALAAGADIDAYCPTCKSVTRHVVIAMKGTRAAKAECKACHSAHAYRKNPPDAKSKKKNQFEGAMEGRDASKALPYKINKKFNTDDLIKHKTFGIGLVTRVLSDKKMEVLFQESTKLLIHGR